MNNQNMGDISMLSPNPPQYQQTTKTQMEMKSKSSTGKAGLAISIVALIIGIIAICFIIGIIITWAVSRRNDNGNPGWRIITGRTNGNNPNNDVFTPDGNDMYVVSATNSLVDVNIMKPAHGVVGRVFMIDNTGNARGCRVSSNNAIITDSIGRGTIESGTTATYMWTGPGNARRLY